jgi:hypothetical protein
MRILVALLLAALAAAGQSIVYTKVFPKSVPAYVKITLTMTGDATYQEEANEAEPVKFRVDATSTGAIFELADKLNHFKDNLESGLKVAKTGDKTYRWENGAASTQTTFNYSTNPDARSLQDWFERITETQRTLEDLQHTYRFDRLGVNDVLLRLEKSWTDKRVVAPGQFVALLDRIHKNEAIVNLARERAANLADAMRAAQ